MPCGSCTNMFADVIARFRWTGQTPLNRPVREQYPLNDLNSIEALGVFFGEVPEKTANTVALKSTDLCIFHVHILSMICIYIYIYHYSLYFHTTHVHLDLEYHNIYIYCKCWHMNSTLLVYGPNDSRAWPSFILNEYEYKRYILGCPRKLVNG